MKRRQKGVTLLLFDKTHSNFTEISTIIKGSHAQAFLFVMKSVYFSKKQEHEEIK